MKKFVIKKINFTISGKPYAEEYSHVEGCVNPKIWEKYNLSPITSPVSYADMLPPLTKKFRVKNKYSPFSK